MCEIGRRFITALPPLHSLHETLYFHRAVTANCPARPAGCRSDDGRDSVLLDQLAHMLLVFLHLFVPVFHAAFLYTAVALP